MSIILQISSDWTNVINAIIFEIVLITLIFFLTADVCARLNYLALVDGSVQDLVVMSPPLVGGGLISTSRKRSLLMIALRSMGILLIFGTALTIDGETIEVLVENTKTVRSPGDSSNLTKEGVVKLINLRYTCAVSFNNSIVFGRLDKSGSCETDNRLLRNAISIRLEVEPTSVSFSGGCEHKNTTMFEDERHSTEYVISTCEQDGRKAKVFCYRSKSQGEIDFTECVASFQLSATKFAVCEYFDQVLEGPAVSIETDCHLASNLGTVQDLWPKAMEITKSTTLIDMIAAASVVDEQSREVENYKRRNVTRLHHMWFLCFAVKLVLLVLLGALSLRLRIKGAKRVLNDDRALLALLKLKLNDWIGVSNYQEQPTIYLHLRTNQEGQKNVWASTMPNYNAVVGSPEAEE